METYETYVSLEVAKLLKEAGFDWHCQSAWDLTFPNEPYLNYNAIYPSDFRNNLDDILYAPTLSVAQKWLRSVKYHFIYVEPLSKDDYSISYICRELNGFTTEEFSTYEEALEAGIKNCLTLILEKGK